MAVQAHLLYLIFVMLLSASAQAADTVQSALESPLRDPANRARDIYRHPAQTLHFFGLESSQHVLEVWPGTGWYSEILAPALKPDGVFFAAQFSEKQQVAYFQKVRADFARMLKEKPLIYSDTRLVSLYPPGGEPLPAPTNSLDLILTFRNVHNWTKAGFDQSMFDSFFSMLKPNGILGVVEHRAKPGTSLELMVQTGYMTEAYVIALAEKAGFRMLEKSEINANPRDNTDHPNGVWSLPPSLRGGDERKSEYLAIGESDRMTIKFIKPGR